MSAQLGRAETCGEVLNFPGEVQRKGVQSGADG